MKNNFFEHKGERSKLARCFYKMLMSGNKVTYRDVLIEMYDDLDDMNTSNHDYYGELKKAVSDVVAELIDKGYLVDRIKESKRKETAYQYLSPEKDPLRNIRIKAEITEKFEDLKTSIKNAKAVKFVYRPFGKKERELVFHPHFVVDYNGRKFCIGVSEMEGRETKRGVVVALDRILGELKNASASVHPYIHAEEKEYNYFAHIVGVTLEPEAELTTIVLRAHDKYTFGRLTTKPLHFSQRTVLWPNWSEGRQYGDVELTVYPNKELVGQILSYGPTLEVLAPEEFRSRIAESIKEMNSRYEDNEPQK